MPDNNIIEQDHRFIKRRIRPMLGFKSFASAASVLAGIELVNMIRNLALAGTTLTLLAKQDWPYALMQ